MNEVSMCLCNEIITEMKRLGFKEVNVSKVSNDIRFIDAIDKENTLQKTMLTMVLYNLLMSDTSGVVPSQIRIALNAAMTVEAWLEDIKLVILPFLKINEEKFFK